ncbi:g2707 [Coccomyxa viridis]|uniref:G2707 protein n=1 Tax=Coccomyxa viridis TaxID=1274662 RepID=A0ABP1FMQ6_9CHLO
MKYQAIGHSGAAHFERGVGNASFQEGAASSSAAPHSMPPQEASSNTSRSGVITFHNRTGTVAFASAPGKARSKDWKARLREYGLSGVLAYGMLNTIYYTATFWYMWTHVYKVPKGIGLAAASRKFVEVLGITWAGSQLTKVARGFGALLLAPVVDKLLTSFQSILRIRSKSRAFLAAVIICLGLAGAVVGTTILLHA